MDFWQYFLVGIIGYSGLAVGLMLALVSKEEIETGRKYFEWLKRVIAFVSVFLVFYFFRLWSYGAIALAVLVVWFLLFRKKNIDIPCFALLGILFWASSDKLLLFSVIAILTFFLGYPVASTFAYQKAKGIPKWKDYSSLLKSLMLRLVFFPILLIILYFLF